MLADRLEYLMTSLPHLVFKQEGEDRKRTIALLRSYGNDDEGGRNLMDIIHGVAATFLTEKEMSELESINYYNVHNDVFKESKSSTLREYSAFSLRLREKIQALRSFRGQSKGNSSIEKHSFIEPGNPLEEEEQILRMQWDAVEALSVGHYSDYDALVAYKLKLMILLRWWSFNTEQGFEIFNKQTIPA